jgi:hypothetical protein
LEDLSPGGNPVHGLLDDEVSEILAVFDQWGDVDRSHRKLAHRGSYEHRFWASPATVLRVLTAAGLRFRSRPRPARTAKRPIPEWVTYRPNQVWIYDTTHFSRAQMAVLIVMDLVSRKWISTVVSAQETSTQVELGFTHALAAEGIHDILTERQHRLDAGDHGPHLPVLLAMSETVRRCLGIDQGIHGHVCHRPHSDDPAPPPIRHGSKPSTVTSKASTRT